VFLAELGDGPEAGAVIGWVHVHEGRLVDSDPRAEVSALIVAEGYQGRGAGRLLMEHAERWARSRGFQTVLLRSNVIRTRAHAFYEKLGYETIKSQKVFRKKL
jgi:GNAT superfamily N-acetyltransferase